MYCRIENSHNGFTTMTNTIFLLNGPNLNLLGTREPEVYGFTTLDDIRLSTEKRAQSLGFAIDFRQSNAEGQLVDWVQEAGTDASGLIINPGAYTHTSIAILDALLAVNIPSIELHLSNVFRREEFRSHSYISKGVVGIISGFGAKGYELAVDAMADIIDTNRKPVA